MTIIIPKWLLWAVGIAIGIPAALLLTLSAYIGGTLLIRHFRGEFWWR